MTRRVARAHAAILVVVFLVLAAWSWRRWPDVLVDYGRELYVAWRLAEGDVLYRDVASFYGPLSPYVDAAWFRLFGTGLLTLAVLDLAIAAGVTAGLYVLLRRAADGSTWSALVGSIVFLAVFAFGHLVANGGFNFVTPYAHEATHGFALALGAILCALRAIDAADPRRWTAGAGALAGMSFLTKPEAFVAALGTTAVLAGFDAVRRNQGAPVVAFLAGLAAPPVVAWLALTLAMPAADAGRAVFGSWAFAGNDDVRGLWYHAWTMGLDAPRANLAALARSAGAQAALAGVIAALTVLAGRRPACTAAIAGGAAAIVVALLWPPLARADGPRALPRWTLIGVLVSGRTLWRCRREATVTTDAARVALALFALLLLPRIVLNARLFHYGFVLAAPATLLVCAALVDWIPRVLDRAAGVVVRSAALSALGVITWGCLAQSHAQMSGKTHAVGAGRDRHFANARGPYVAAAMDGIARLEPEDGTLVVLPEGVMINYLLRRRSSIPYLTMLPSDLATFGEDELLAALQRSPPDFIALVHRDSSEMGPRFFGRDYGRRTLDWIRARYVPAGGVGDPPNDPASAFGIRVLRRAR